MDVVEDFLPKRGAHRKCHKIKKTEQNMLEKASQNNRKWQTQAKHSPKNVKKGRFFDKRKN